MPPVSGPAVSLEGGTRKMLQLSQQCLLPDRNVTRVSRYGKKVNRDNIFQSADFRYAHLHDYLILSAQEVLQSQILHYILSILILCDNLLQRNQSGVIYL